MNRQYLNPRMEYRGLCWSYENLSQLKAFTTTYSVLSPIIFTTNCLLIALLFKTKQTSMVSNYFILALSISDACLGGIALPISLILQHQQIPEQLLSIPRFFIFALMYFSLIMVLTIALDRFLHIFYSNYRQSMTSLKAKLVVAAVGFFASGYAAGNTWVCLRKERKLFSLVSGTINISLFVLACGMYIVLYLKVRSSWRSTGQQGKAATRNAKHVTHLATTAFTILLSLFVCYSPYLITTIIIYIELEKTRRDTGPLLLFIYQVTSGFVLGNSVVNALVVLYRNRAIRRYIRGTATEER